MNNENPFTTDDPTTTASVLANAIHRAAEPTNLEPGKVYAFPTSDGDIQVVDCDLDKYRDRPRRKTGTVQLHDPASLLAFVEKHSTIATEMYADVKKVKVTAVLNSHEGSDESLDPGLAGWSDHRAEFRLEPTVAWEAWRAHDQAWLDQTAFAEFIEDHMSDIATPDAATMLEVAQSISAKTKASFQSSKRLSNGQTSIEYREEIDGKAGEAGHLQIPTDIVLAITPFEGVPTYEVKARFRYRINKNQLVLSYKLLEPERITRHAFDAVVETISAGFTGPVFWGAEPPKP